MWVQQKSAFRPCFSSATWLQRDLTAERDLMAGTRLDQLPGLEFGPFLRLDRGLAIGESRIALWAHAGATEGIDIDPFSLELHAL